MAKKKNWLLERTGIMGYFEVPRVVWIIAFVINLIIPDPLPFLDEVTLLWLSLKKGK